MSPPNNDLNSRERQKEFEDLEHQRTWFEGGGRVPYWWVWLVVVIGVFLFFAGWGWNSSHATWWGRNQVPGIPEVTGTGLSVLNSTNKAPYVGQSVNLRNVAVQQKVNDDVFWIGTEKNPMLLVLANSANGNNTTSSNAPNNNAPNSNTTKSGGSDNRPVPENVRQGDRIAINAKVEKSPSADEARQEWKLSSGDANRLERQQAYLQAPQVEQINRYGH